MTDGKVMGKITRKWLRWSEGRPWGFNAFGWEMGKRWAGSVERRVCFLFLYTL